MTSSPYRAGRNAQSLYENVELLTGQRGDGLDKALTLRDLSQLGMVQLNRRARGHYAAIPIKGKSQSKRSSSVPRCLALCLSVVGLVRSYCIGHPLYTLGMRTLRFGAQAATALGWHSGSPQRLPRLWVTLSDPQRLLLLDTAR